MQNTLFGKSCTCCCVFSSMFVLIFMSDTKPLKWNAWTSWNGLRSFVVVHSMKNDDLLSSHCALNIIVILHRIEFNENEMNTATFRCISGSYPLKCVAQFWSLFTVWFSWLHSFRIMKFLRLSPSFRIGDWIYECVSKCNCCAQIRRSGVFFSVAKYPITVWYLIRTLIISVSWATDGSGWNYNTNLNRDGTKHS